MYVNRVVMKNHVQIYVPKRHRTYEKHLINLLKSSIPDISASTLTILSVEILEILQLYLDLHVIHLAPTPLNLAPAVPRLAPTFLFHERVGDNFFRARANTASKRKALKNIAGKQDSGFEHFLLFHNVFSFSNFW